MLLDFSFKTRQTTSLAIVALAIVLGFTGCDSGGSSGKGRNQQPNNSNPIDLRGIAQANRVVGGTVTVFKLVNGVKDVNLGEGGTSLGDPGRAPGSFEIFFENDPDYEGPVLVEVTGGTYVDEVTGQTVTLSGTLRAVVADTSSDPEIVVSPLTTLATALARAATGGATAANITAANAQVAALFGGSFDLLTTKPVDMTLTDTTVIDPDVSDYTLAIAAFSQLAADLALSPSQLLSQLEQDIRDGRLDARNGATAVGAESAITKRLARALVTIQQSSNNNRGLTLQQATLDAVLASDGEIAGTALTGLDRIAPQVIEVFPKSRATMVSTSSRIYFRFSENVDSATVNGSTIVVMNGTTPVTGSVSYSAVTRTATFTATGSLPSTATLSASAMTGIRDLAGNALATARNTTFETDAGGSGAAPVLVSLTPAPGAASVGAFDVFVATFDRPLDPGSVFGASTVNLQTGGNTVPVTVTYNVGGNTFTVVPVSPLATGANYTLSINTSLLSATGVPLLTSVSRSFATAAMDPAVIPSVAATTPANNGEVGPNQPLNAIFSESMAPASAQGAVALFQGATPVAGSATYSSAGGRVEFIPNQPLQRGLSYTFVIGSGAADLSGATLAADVRVDFTVEAPSFTIVTPSLPDALTNQPYTQTISAIGGLNPVTFALSGGSLLPSGLTLDANGTLSGTPTASGMTSFTVQATDGAGLVATQSYTLNVVDMAVNASVSFAQPSQSTSDESTRTVSVALRLDAPSTTTSATTVTVNLAATGSAIAGADFTFTTQTVTFPAGSSNGAVRSIPVGISADTIFEGNETIVLGLTGPGAGAGATHTLTITDDDAQPTLSFGAASATIAETGGSLTLTATLSNPTTQAVSASFAVAGSANNPADHGLSAGSISIPATIQGAGNTTATITVPVTDDMLDEDDESIEVTLGSPVGATLGATPMVVITITDNDLPPTLSVANVTVTEGSSGTTMATFTVTQSAPSGRAVSVDIATADGSATVAGGDYAAANATLTIAAGDTTADFTVAVSGDQLSEDTESFSVSLSNAVNSSILNGTATGTVTDDDAAPSLAIDSPSVTESDTGPTTLSFTVTMTGATGRDVTVDFATADGTAAAGQDYSASSGSLTFTEGGVMTQSVDVTVLGDTIDEDDETFTVSLANASNATISTATGTGTILDNENAPSASFAAGAVTLNEGVGTAGVSVSLSTASARDVTVPFTVNAAGTALNPADVSDIDMVNRQVRQYLSNNGSNAAAATVSALTPLTLNNTALQSQAEHAVGNNEGVVVDVFGNLYQAGDVAGQSPSIRVFKNVTDRSPSQGFDPVVDKIIVGPSTGLTAPKGMDVDSTAGLLFVADFGAGNVKVFSTGAVNDATPLGTTTLAANPWDLDYDPIADRLYVALTNGTVAVFDAYVAGGFGATGADRTITPFDSGLQVSVNLHGIVHNAATDELYLSDVGAPSSPTDGQLFRVSGAAAADGNVTVAAAIGGNLTNLGNPVDLAFDGENLYVVEKSNNRILIYGDFANSTSGNIAANVEVLLAAGTGPESLAIDPGDRRDHTLVDGAVMIPAGQTSGTTNFTIDDDSRFENPETIIVELGTPTNAVLGATTTQTITVTDNDTVLPRLTVEDLTILEPNNGNSANALVVVRSDTAVGRAVTVDFATADGSAVSTSGGDFTATSGTVTFAEGEVFGVIAVEIVGDNLNEVDETFTVTLSNPTSSAIARTTATVTIQNNDNLPSLLIDSPTVTEAAGSVAFTVTLDAASGQTVTVDYATTGGSAVSGNDFTSTSGTLTFAPGGSLTQTITVPVSTDGLNEADESFSMLLSGAVNAMIPANTGIATILDDDATAISFGDITVIEGDSGATAATFTLSLSVMSEQTISVDFATAAGTATAGTDFTSLSQTVTIAAGTLSRQVTVDVAGDALSEVNETFTSSLANATGRGVSIATGSATATIMDDDPVTLSLSGTSVTEGTGGTVTATFAVSLSGPNGQSITVDFASADGSATAPSDYASVSGTLTFAPGVSMQTIDVAVSSDNLNEVHEAFSVAISNATGNGVSIAAGSAMATGSITDDDDLTLSIADLTITEGSSGTTTATLTVTLSGMSQQTPTVDFSTDNAMTGIPASVGADYTANSGTVSFAGGATTATIDVAVAADTAPERTEMFAVNLTNANGRGISIADGAATVTITDDDDATVGFAAATRTVNEDAGTVTYTIGSNGPKDQAINVPFTLNGSSTATNPTDFSDIDMPALLPRVYVSNNGSNAGQIDALQILIGSGAFRNKAALGAGNNEGVVLDTNGNLYQAGDVSGDPASIRIVRNVSNLADGSAFEPTRDSLIVGTATGLVAPKGIDVATEAGLIFVADFGAGEVKVFRTSDTGNAAPSALATTTANPWDLDFDATTNTLYVALTDGTVAVFPVTITSSTVSIGAVARTITPADGGGAKASTNLHGIVHDAVNDELYLSDVGSASVADDGRLFRITGAAAASGLTTVATDINHPTLGNPVDIAWDGANLYVAEKSNDRILVYTDFRTIMSGTVAANLERPQTKPESIALDPGTRRDHNLTAGTFTFQPGDTSASVSFTLVQDGRNEASETLAIDLGAPTGPAVSGPITSQTLNILDNNTQPRISIEDVTITETSGGMNTVATLRVTLDIASGRTVSVGFSTAAGSAATPDDFTSASGTLVFAEGEVTEFVDITVIGDDLNEAVETFTVSLANELNAIILDGSATATINDDDGVPTLSIDDVTLTEGDSGTQDATFTVTLSATSGRPVTVAFAAQGGTAVAPEDYSSTSGTLTYAAGETTKTITVPVIGDAVNEAHESFTVELSGATNATIADASGLATINDNDDITVTLAGPGTITEGDGGTTAATFTLTLSGPSRQLVMTDIASAAGTATAGSDFTALSQTLTFSPGTTSRTATVDVNADNLSEVDESFSATISNPVGRGVTLGASSATVTITDDDPVTISIADGTIIEGDMGTVTLSFAVTLSGPNGQTITIDFATADGSAVAPADYTTAGGTLTFAPGVSSGMVDVTVAGDAINEADESFNVMLSNAAGNGVSIASGMANATISDNDNITVSVGDVTVTETSTGTVFANFPLTLSGASEQSVTVNYQTADSSATAPADYTAANSSLTFTPGQTAATVGISVVGDTAAELDETFVLSLTAASGRGVSIGTANGTATIMDDDLADIDFSTATSFLNEGAGTLTLTLNLSGPKGQAITVPILLNGSAGALTPDFSDLDTPTTIARTYVALNDPAGATELSGMTGTSSAQEATYTTGNNEGVVLDTDGTLYQAGDVPGQTPSIRIFKKAAARGATASYDPLVDSIIRGSATTLVNPKGIDVDTNRGLIFVADFGASAITVFKTSDVGNVAPTGTLTLATKPWDLDYDPTNDRLFVALTDGTVAVFDSYTTNFGAGGPTRIVTPTDAMGAVISTNLHGIVYNAAADQLYLSDVGSAAVANDGQLFLIDGAAAATGNTAVTISIGAGTQGGTNTNAMLGNPVDIAFDGRNLYVAEKSQNLVLVFTDFATKMSGDTAPDMSFARTRPESIALDPGTRRDTDFTGGSVTFAPGTTTATFEVKIIADGLSEGDETFTFSLGAVTGPGQAGATTPSSAITIINDVNTSVPDVSIAGVTVLETDAGADTTARLMITLDEIAGRTVSVNFSTADGTATQPGDYTSTSGTVTFAAGEALKFVDIPVKGDDDNEPNETFTVSLDTLVNCEPGTTTATVTITDNDGAPLIDITGGTTDEETMGTPGAVTFTVTLSRTSGQPVTVDFATASGTATQGNDFTAQSGTLTWAPGETSKTVTVAVLGDAVNEAPESFTVGLSNPTNSSINTAAATGSITDNDATVVTLEGPATAITETTGGSTAATFTVRLSVVSEQTIAVNFSTADGTATVADGDFTANNSTVTLTPGATSATATVLVTGDNKSELDETFMASIGGLAPTGTGVTLGAATSSTVTITDDDPIAISIAGASVGEGAGMANFVVSLSGANGQTVTVDFATADGTAVAGAMGAGDYDSQTGTLTFGPGVTTQTVAVAIIDEAINEVDEAFSVSISNPTGNLVSLDVNNSTATGAIADDDTATVNIADAAITEVDSGATVTLNVPITRLGASEQAISVNVSTTPVTATAGSDFDMVNSTFVIPASGADETFNVPVTIQGDNINEIDETFTVTITAVAGRGAVIGTATATATITENDPLPTLDISSATVSEDVGMVNLTVSLTGLSGRTVTVDVATAEGTATSSGDLDFTALPTTTLTFAPLETSKTVSIGVINDTRNEITESFTASLSNVVGGMIGTATGTVTINDNDPLMVSINDRTVTEGDGASPAGDVAMTFTVSLDRVSEQTVTFDFATADLPTTASARAGLDYTALTQTVTFMAGSTTLSQPVTVTILPDATNEAAETFNVSLSNLMFANGMNPPAAPTDGSGFARPQGTGSIFDEDPLTITIADSSVTEGDASNVDMSFTVTTDIQSEQNIVLSYSSAAGTAALGADFTAAGGQLVINPGSQTATFNVSVVGERINEANETFTTSIALVGQPNLVTITDATATGTINDNDDLTVTIFQPSGPVTEGTNADFRIRLSIATEQSFTIRARAEELTASQNQDFVATETDFESLTSFTPVLGVPQAIFSVPVNNDDLYETDQLFLGRIFAPSPLPRGVSINTLSSQANATILDTDALTITLTGPVTVAESVGSAVYTARLDGVGAQGTMRLEQEVAVTYRTAEGTATYVTPTNDLEDTTSLVTFPAGSMSAGMVSRTFGVVVIDDNINEATEAFSVNFVTVTPLPRITNNTATFVTNITDNDTATLTINDVTVTEGTFGEPTVASFTVTTDTQSQGVLSVTGTTLDGTANGGGLGGAGRTIRTLAGTGMAGFSGDGGLGSSAQINNPADAVVDPANGRVYFIDSANQRIRVANVQSGTIATVAGTGATGLQDGPGFQATFSFSPSSRLVLEPGSDGIVFSDTGNHAIRRFDLVTGNVTTLVGTGAPGNTGDGGLGTLATLSSPAGLDYDSAGNLYIADSGNDVVRRVLTTGIIERYAGTGANGDNTNNTDRLTVATFDTLLGLAYDRANNTLYLGDPANNYVYTVIGNTVARFLGTGAATFNGDGMLRTATTVSAPNDLAVLRNGDLVVADNTHNRVRLVTRTTGIVSTIVGNGTASPYGGDLTNLAVDSQVDPRGIALAPSGELYMTTINNQRVFRIGGGFLDDFVAKQAVASIPAFTSTTTYTVEVVQDNINERTETYSVQISGPSSDAMGGMVVLGAASTGTGTILDDDPIFLNVRDLTMLEGTAGAGPPPGAAPLTPFNVQVELRNTFDTIPMVSQQPISFIGTTTNGTALGDANQPLDLLDDYASRLGDTETFQPGTPTLSFIVQINADDLNEPVVAPIIGETFFVTLSNQTRNDGMGNVTVPDVTIDDSQATVTIIDDDIILISIDDISVTEGTNVITPGNFGTTDFTFTLSLNITNQQTVRVQLDTMNGVVAGREAFAIGQGSFFGETDYTARSMATVSFPPTITTAQFTVSVSADNYNEPDEIFTVNLSNPQFQQGGMFVTNTGAVDIDTTGGRNVGTAIILDDDDLVITIANTTLTEGDNAGDIPGSPSSFTGFTPNFTNNAVFAVSFNIPSEGAIRWDTTFTNGPTAAGIGAATNQAPGGPGDRDYNNAAINNFTVTPGTTMMNFPVPVAADDVNELNERFTANFANLERNDIRPPGAANFQPDANLTGGMFSITTSATATIMDDDNLVLTVGDTDGDNNLAEATADTVTVFYNVLGGASTATNTQQTINYTLAHVAGTPTTATFGGANSDYLRGAGPASFTSNNVGQKNFLHGVFNDARNEATERFQTSATRQGAPRGVTVTTLNSQTFAILDNDNMTFTIGTTAVPVAEGGTATYIVTRTNATMSEQAFTVVVNTADGTAVQPEDYAQLSNVVVITSTGAPGAPVTVVNNGATSSGIVDDNINEGAQGFNVTHAFGPGSMTNNLTLAGAVATVIPANDPLSFDIAGAPASVAEGGSLTLSFTTTGPLMTQQNFTLALVTGQGGDTATESPVANSDYTSADQTLIDASAATPTNTVTFTNPANVSVPVTDDATNEANETFASLLNLMTGAGNITLGGTTVTTTIPANDPIMFTLTAGMSSINEGATSMYTVGLGAMSATTTEQSFTLNFATGAVGDAARSTAPADYNAVNSNILVATGTPGNPFPIPNPTVASPAVTTIDDTNINEGPQGFTSSLSLIGAPQQITVALPLVVTINANDLLTYTVSGPGSATEGATATFTLAQTNAAVTMTEQSFTLGFRTGFGGDTAIEGADYISGDATVLTSTGTPALAFTLPALANRNVSITDDNINEGNEVFGSNLQVTAGTPAQLNTPGAPTNTTITANDPLNFTIMGPATVTEGATAMFTITETNGRTQTQQNFTLNLAVNPQTVGANASTVADFNVAGAGGLIDASAGAPGNTVTFTNMFMSSVTAVDDTINEPDQDFISSLMLTTTAGNIAAGAGTITTTISANDPVTYSLPSSFSVTEGATDTRMFAVTGAGMTEQTYNINFVSNVGGTFTATKGTDFSNSDAMVGMFMGSATNVVSTALGTPSVMIMITDDTINEGDETYTTDLTATGAPQQVNLPVGVETTIILANDPITFMLAGPPTSINEGATAVYTISVMGPTMSEQSFTLDFQTLNGNPVTATEGMDYVSGDASAILTVGGSPGSPIDFSGFAASPAAMRMIMTTDDMTNEFAETFNGRAVVMGAAMGVNSSLQVATTINANDPIIFTLTDMGTSVMEGSDAMFTIGLQAGSAMMTEQTFDVDFTSMGGTATQGMDYTDATQTVVSLTGSAGSPVAVTIGTPMVNVPVLVDAINEPTQSFEGDLAISAGTPLQINTPGTPTTINILDQNMVDITVTQSLPGPFNEGENFQANFAIADNGGGNATTSIEGVLILNTTTGGTATPTVDFTFDPNPTLGGAVPGGGVENIVIVNDGAVPAEGAETFTITYSAADPTRVGTITTPTVSATINAN